MLAARIAPLFMALVLMPGTATREAQAADRWLCPDGRVSVTALSERSAHMVCAQAARARAFLAQCGVFGRQELDVRVTRDLLSPSGWRRSGDYDPSTRRVRLLPFAAYALTVKPRIGSAPVLARTLHASVASHEIAHGIFHEHTRHLDLPDTAHEYVAYAVQLSTLPEEVQKALAEHKDLRPIGNLFQFSYFLLRADPERFALAAWRHFNQPENGCAFLDRLVRGQVHFPPPGD
jgi:hypothetical protein